MSVLRPELEAGLAALSLDLALGIEGAAAHHFFLVAPDNRQGEVRTQFWPTCVLPRV